MSEQEVQQPALPRINEPAPQFEQVSTFGKTTLAEYKGKWVVLFSHPADFTTRLHHRIRRLREQAGRVR